MSVRMPPAGASCGPGREGPREPSGNAQRTSSEDTGRISLRAVLLGIGLAALLAAVNPFVDFLARDWHVGSGSLLQGPLAVLFLLMLANSALVRLLPGSALSRREFVAIYAIGIVSVGLVRQGGIPYMVSATVYPFHFASPSNGWQHLIWPYIPSWLTPGDARAAAWFWSGLPKEGVIPFDAWLLPLASWGVFTIALLVACLSLGALITPDWVERQRLTFPLADVPMEMVGHRSQPTLGASVFSSRIFWVGFLLASSVILMEWLHRTYPSVPAPTLEVYPGSYFVGKSLPWSMLSETVLSIRFAVVGVSYLIPANVSLSLWAFYLLHQLQLLGLGAIGITPAGGPASLDPHQFISYQEAGGFLALAGVVLYQSRTSLSVALGGLLGARTPQGRPLRGAMLAFVVANGVLLVWAIHAGSSWWSFCLLMGIYYAVMICAAWLVAAAGVLYVDTRFRPREIMINTLGARALGQNSLVMYAYYSVAFMSDPMNLAMPQVANSYRLLHGENLSWRGFTRIATLAVAVVLVVGSSSLLAMVYRHGAASLGSWPLTSFSQWEFAKLDASLRSPEAADNRLRAALAIGGAAALSLSWLHTHCAWWPLSPIGFLLASTWCMNWLMWSSVMLGWAANRLVNRYGGLRLFRRVRPAFVGLILGDFLAKALLGIVSYLIGIEDLGWA